MVPALRYRFGMSSGTTSVGRDRVRESLGSVAYSVPTVPRPGRQEGFMMSQATDGMKGGGYYDSHSEYQRRVAASGSQALVALITKMGPVGADPFTIVDYGCSEGANSVAAIGEALRALRQLSGETMVVAIHNDLPTNDFNALFRNLLNRADSYLRIPGGRVLPMASATSFYEPVVAPGIAQLGVSFSAAHWLREEPQATAANSFLIADATGEARDALARQADADWTRFLAMRASDLGPGGVLFLQMIGSLPADGEGQKVTARELIHAMYDIAEGMVDEGRLRQDALDHYVFPTYMRTADEARTPLDRRGSAVFGAFRIDVAQVDPVPNPYFETYLKTGDARAYAEHYVAFVRAFSESTIRKGLLGPGVIAGSLDAAVDDFYAELQRRTALDPEWSKFEDWTLTVALTRLDTPR